MSKDSSYEVEREEPLAVWTNFGHYKFLNDKLAVLFRFLAAQELARYASTQIHFKLRHECGDTKGSVLAAAVAVPSSYTLNAANSEVATVVRNFITPNAHQYFSRHGFIVRIFHGDLSTPYAIYELQVTSSGEVTVRLEEFCFGHKWEWTKVAQLNELTLTSQRTFELIYLDWMREVEVIAALAVSSAYKNREKELHHGCK